MKDVKTEKFLEIMEVVAKKMHSLQIPDSEYTEILKVYIEYLKLI